MASARGKRVAILAAALALAVLVAASFSAWPWLVEEFHIRQLNSEDEASQISAARALGEARSTRAVPQLIGLLNTSTQKCKLEAVSAIFQIGEEALPQLREAARQSGDNSYIFKVAAMLEDCLALKSGQPPP